MFFKAVFRPRNPEETIALDKLLQAKLRAPNDYGIGHHSRIVTIDVPDQGGLDKTRDECFKVAEWARHNNGKSDRIPYTVCGFEGNPPLLVYDSGCPQCRTDKTPHKQHEVG